jgi:hypothetical protein
VCGETDVNQTLYDRRGRGEWEMRWGMLLREKGGFVEIDIAAWLSTNGSSEYSKIFPIKVAQGTVIRVGI